MKSDILKGIIMQLRLRLRRRPKPPVPEPPSLVWERMDPESEAARAEILKSIEEDALQQAEELSEALRSPN